MKISSQFTRIKIVLTAVILGVAYLYLSSPGKIVVQDNGKVDGLINQVREVLQGRGFWKKQLLEVDKELSWELGEPKRNAELTREDKAWDREVDKIMKQLYRENPDMRPSAAERRAEKLRERADAIEQVELERELEQIRHQRIAELRRIKRLVEMRAK